MSETEQSASKPVPISQIIFGFVLVMSIYVFVRLSHSQTVVLIALIGLAILEAVILAREYKSMPKYDVAFEASYVGVLFAFMLFAKKYDPIEYSGMFVPAIFYRPYYLKHGNRGLALLLGLLILVFILIPASGFVSDRETIGMFWWAATFAVAVLWLFCSKVWVWFTA